MKALLRLEVACQARRLRFPLLIRLLSPSMNCSSAFSQGFLETISFPSPVTLLWIRETCRAFGSIQGKGV